jgi:uncharacterized membrane protein YgaE (UPF0421/DUF939 family)
LNDDSKNFQLKYLNNNFFRHSIKKIKEKALRAYEWKFRRSRNVESKVDYKRQRKSIYIIKYLVKIIKNIRPVQYFE